MLDLPAPALDAPVQTENAATAIAAIHALGARVDVLPERSAGPGRGPCARSPAAIGERPLTLVDVDTTRRPPGRWPPGSTRRHAVAGCVAVYGALADKDVGGVFAALGAGSTIGTLRGWIGETPRGLAGQRAGGDAGGGLPRVDRTGLSGRRVGLEAARADAGPDDVRAVVRLVLRRRRGPRAPHVNAASGKGVGATDCRL